MLMLVLDFVIEEVHPSEQKNTELKKGSVCSMQYGGHFVGLNHSSHTEARRPHGSCSGNFGELYVKGWGQKCMEM